MLWAALAINGYAIAASDGRIGTVSDFLFEDAGWAVRWLVVDTGHWLSGRKVLLPVSALGQPDRELRHFPVKLSLQRVKNSPDVDTDRPVSRQFEAHIYDYFGWDPYWGGSLYPMVSGMGTPIGIPLNEPVSTRDASICADAPHNAENPHLRSAATVTGYHIHANDGEIGHIEDFLVDDTDWDIRYIKVDTKNWWPGERVLISPRSVRRIDWISKLIYVDANRQKIKDAPSYDPTITVDGAYEETFQTYYGIRWVAA
mgnify:CR=1 FL=1